MLADHSVISTRRRQVCLEDRRGVSFCSYVACAKNLHLYPLAINAPSIQYAGHITHKIFRAADVILCFRIMDEEVVVGVQFIQGHPPLELIAETLSIIFSGILIKDMTLYIVVRNHGFLNVMPKSLDFRIADRMDPGDFRLVSFNIKVLNIDRSGVSPTPADIKTTGLSAFSSFRVSRKNSPAGWDT